METFKIKTEVCFKADALEKLTEFEGINAVVFTDPFMVKSGVVNGIVDKLSKCKNVSVFGNIAPDPSIELIAEGLEFLLKANADIVVALGGGSSIDAAKSVMFMARRAGGNANMKLIAIPTTSGTGSEVTKFAVITDKQKGVKYPLVNDELLPDMALLDPHLVVTAPPAITAATGFDVITHALEAYISVNANDFSDALAEKSLQLAFEYLPKAYKNGSDVVAREKMHTASCLAGMAFNDVNLGVNHGIAHALGAKFHIPHGKANAMILPYVMEFNANIANNFGSDKESTASVKLAKIAKMIDLPSTSTKIAVEALISHLKYMLRMTGIPSTLALTNVTKADYENVKASIIESALKDACTTANPREVTADDVEAILNNIAIW